MPRRRTYKPKKNPNAWDLELAAREQARKDELQRGIDAFIAKTEAERVAFTEEHHPSVVTGRHRTGCTYPTEPQYGCWCDTEKPYEPTEEHREDPDRAGDRLERGRAATPAPAPGPDQRAPHRSRVVHAPEAGTRGVPDQTQRPLGGPEPDRHSPDAQGR